MKIAEKKGTRGRARIGTNGRDQVLILYCLYSSVYSAINQDHRCCMLDQSQRRITTTPYTVQYSNLSSSGQYLLFDETPVVSRCSFTSLIF